MGVSFMGRRRASNVGRCVAAGSSGSARTEEVRADRARVGEFIRSSRSDGDTLDPFAAREDKEYVFSPDRGAALAYRSLFGVALGSGDPIGARDQFLDCVRQFVVRSDGLGLRPVIMLVREDRLALYQGLGFKTLYLGDEAILDVATFTLDSPRMRNVRQAVKRSANFGVTTEIMQEADIPSSLVDSLREITVRARNGKREEGFSAALEEPFSVPQPHVSGGSLSRSHGHTDRIPTIFIVQREHEAVGRRHASRPGCAQRYRGADDLRGPPMGPEQRDHRAFPQLRRVSQASPEPGCGFWERDHGTRHQTLQSCWRTASFAFTNKFRPQWVSRYVAYRSLSDIPRFAVATLSAEGRLPPWVVRLGIPRHSIASDADCSA